MTRDKLRERLAKAEAAQEQVDSFERRADRLVRDKYGSLLAVAKTDEDREALRLYHLNKELEGNTLYNSAVGQRNSSREWVKVYALTLLAGEE